MTELTTQELLARLHGCVQDLLDHDADDDVHYTSKSMSTWLIMLDAALSKEGEQRLHDHAIYPPEAVSPEDCQRSVNRDTKVTIVDIKPGDPTGETLPGILAGLSHKENTNCLEGMKCPQCDSLGQFQIESTCWAFMSDDGSEATEEIEWSEDSHCSCVQCGFHGKVYDFESNSKRYWVTKYEVEVLSEEPIPDSMELPEVLQEATDGRFSGDIKSERTWSVDGESMARMLIEQRSDPGFFNMGLDGQEICDECEHAPCRCEASEIVRFLQDHHIESEHLDELVHDSYSEEASGVNNSDLEEQVVFLLESGVSEDYIMEMASVPSMVTELAVACKFCKKTVSARTAHLHDGSWVGDSCCWDERLKSTE